MKLTGCFNGTKSPYIKKKKITFDFSRHNPFRDKSPIKGIHCKFCHQLQSKVPCPHPPSYRKQQLGHSAKSFSVHKT